MYEGCPRIMYTFIISQKRLVIETWTFRRKEMHHLCIFTQNFKTVQHLVWNLWHLAYTQGSVCGAAPYDVVTLQRFISFLFDIAHVYLNCNQYSFQYCLNNKCEPSGKIHMIILIVEPWINSIKLNGYDYECIMFES